MAEELKIKVRVDSSDVSRGTDEAKSKVQQAADAMKKSVADSASSMKQSTADASANMKHSMESVAKSTESIGDAAKSAENAVKEMDRGVAKSAANMEKNLASVRRQMGAMQAFNMGARAVNMVAGAAKNVAILNGNKDAVESIDATAGVLTGGIQGAAMGFAFTGGNPIGAAVGGLIGAGAALLDAAAKQREAAEKQLEVANRSIQESKEKIDVIDEEYRSRQRSKLIADLISRPWGKGPGELDMGFALGQLSNANAGLATAEKNQQRVQDMIYGRNGQTTTVEDWSKIVGGMKFKIGGIEYDLSNFDLPKDVGVIDWMSSGREKAIAKFFAEAFHDDYIEEFERIALAYAAAGLPPPVRPESLRPEDFDEQLITEITSKIFKALESQAVEAATAVSRAQQVVAEFGPLQNRVDKERSASIGRLRQKLIEDYERMNAPLNFNDDELGIEDVQDQSAFEAASSLMKRREAMESFLSDSEGSVKYFQKLLSGLANFAASPTDALTKIGGGVGYTSYNNSVLTVTKSIEKSLNTLIENQLRQNEELKTEIQNLKFLESTWQQ